MCLPDILLVNRQLFVTEFRCLPESIKSLFWAELYYELRFIEARVLCGQNPELGFIYICILCADIQS